MTTLTSPSRLAGLLGLALAVSACFGAQAQDSAETGQDHPLVGRYEGASIRAYKQQQFDEASLLQAPVDYQSMLERDALEDRSGAAWLKLEGRRTRIRYEAPAERSSLELFRNYESKLKANGFEQVYACNDNACLAGSRKDPSQLGDLLDNFDIADNGRHYANHARYGLYKATRPEGVAYVALLAGDSDEGHILPRVLVDVVETKSMDADKVKAVAATKAAEAPAVERKEPAVTDREPKIQDREPKIQEHPTQVKETPAQAKTSSAAEMARAIARTGNISVYGILFDFDKSEIKPESKPQLDQISQLLKDDASLKVAVIGHTDNKGTPAYNLALSQRRADAVVLALARDYGIAGTRLLPQGKGDTQPVADNASDAGRAKNRRVELAKL
ncbi:OmpA family protein [Lysobacter gummosus]|uniref:OmpA family protein n=1 Tax=Lysobacter gummosus TaxID=262324 RepID=A0ABY3XI74_9GAMM|nr:OmpA family protein [Lysobacter gummosus]ALN90899.1 ompA family protein [Lysobacter gummosus]UNP31349.1 OmpA family protein [Lysobacter gummosus]